jgi:hypothetical protein
MGNRSRAAVPASWDAQGTSSCNADGRTLRCLIVDDSPRFQEASRGLLERQGITVVGVASTSAEALQQAERLRPAPAQYANLPGLPFPAGPDTYPGKDDVADYLQAYAHSSSCRCGPTPR